MFLNFEEWISPTPVPCRYFILLISTCSYATDAPFSVLNVRTDSANMNFYHAYNNIHEKITQF